MHRLQADWKRPPGAHCSYRGIVLYSRNSMISRTIKFSFSRLQSCSQRLWSICKTKASVGFKLKSMDLLARRILYTSVSVLMMKEEKMMSRSRHRFEFFLLFFSFGEWGKRFSVTFHLISRAAGGIGGGRRERETAQVAFPSASCGICCYSATCLWLQLRPFPPFVWIHLSPLALPSLSHCLAWNTYSSFLSTILFQI